MAEDEEMPMSRDSMRMHIAAQKRAQRTAKLGSGERFAALKKSIAARGGVRDPAAVAASIGRKKLGAARFQRLAVAAKRRKGGR